MNGYCAPTEREMVIQSKNYFVYKPDYMRYHIVASELKDPICHSDECQIGSFSSEATRLYALSHSCKR